MPTRRKADRRIGLAVAVVAMGAVVGCGQSGSASIGFGTGGVDCDLASVGSTFPAGTTVRMVATISPLPPSVTVQATRDGEPLHDRQVIELDGTVPCVYGELPDLDAGRYEVVVTIPESPMPPLTAGFEVTP